MASDKEYIKLYRKLLENQVIFKDNDHLALWVHLLLTVNWKTGKGYLGGDLIELKPGQNIYGRKALSDKTHISESKIERILKRFESEHQIEQQTSSKNRLITIVNWSSYQNCEQQNEQQVNNKWTTSEQQVDTKEEVKNKRTKEVLKDIGVFDQYCSDDLPLRTTLSDFETMRKSIKKPLTEKGKQLLCSKLDELKAQGHDRIECLNNSIMNNWQGVFAPKVEVRKGRNEPIPEYSGESSMTPEKIEELKERLRNRK